MMKDCIFAYTPKGSYPPYLNISLSEDGKTMVVTVRGEANGRGQQQIADIELPLVEQNRLCSAFIRLDQSRCPW